MLNLTIQERRTLLFLLTVSLIGLCINFLVKNSPGIERIVKINERSYRQDINRIDYENLQNLPGLTPKLARKIIEYRQSQGPFSNIEELKKIKGIGNFRYERLKDLFYIE